MADPRSILAAARAEGRTALSEAAGKALLACFGIATPRALAVRDAADALAQMPGLRGPLVAKVISPQILHKTDAGGVALGLADAAAVAAAIERMAMLPAIAAAEVEGWLVEEMAPAGQQFVVGGFRDPRFGPMLMVGLGGIFVEVLGDVAFLCRRSTSSAALTQTASRLAAMSASILSCTAASPCTVQT